MRKKITMDDVPMSSIHYKMFIYTGGSSFLDGYVMGIIAVALSVMQTQFEMTATIVGLIGTATLSGMFVGGIIGGYFTDIFGRKKMFIITMIIIVFASIPQFFLNEPSHLVLYRFILGIAIGADFPVAGTLMSEFSPKKNRGSLLRGLIGMWYVGYAVSYLTGYLMLPLGVTSWRWMLLSCGIPAFILLIARINMPESPRWLVNKGKEKEANDIIKKIFGDHVLVPIESEKEEKTTFLGMFKNGYGKLVLFVSLFWTLQIAAVYAIGTYIPEILSQFGFGDGSKEYLGSAIINALYLLGILPGLYALEKYGRRPTLIVPFLVSSISLIVLGITSGMGVSFTYVLVFFIIYGIFSTAMCTLQWVYPNELFPTHIRGTAMGFTTGVSRIASSLVTFLFPISMANFGLAPTLYFLGALLFIGFVVSIIMAPETRNMSLAEASALNEQAK